MDRYALTIYPYSLVFQRHNPFKNLRSSDYGPSTVIGIYNQVRVPGVLRNLIENIVFAFAIHKVIRSDDP